MRASLLREEKRKRDCGDGCHPWSREEGTVATPTKLAVRGSEQLAEAGCVLMVEPLGLANKLEERNQESLKFLALATR